MKTRKSNMKINSPFRMGSPMKCRSFTSSLLLLLAVFSWPAAAADFFSEKVAPVLEAKCLACHNPNNIKGKLSLATRESMLERKDVLVPGDAKASNLYWVTIPEEVGEAPEMPEDGEALTADEVAALKRWIDDGAKWPEGVTLREKSKTDKSWWAYQPLKAEIPKPTPAIGAAWHGNIDRFVAAKLHENGLVPNKPADRRTLIRRATYDLTGLPPTLEEVEAFVNDPAEDAYDKLLDRLLASPRYGERWGRHWLDVVRFGESNGYERNFIINSLYPFRDYVIRSINDDKPFNQFIREHLAGDVIGKGKLEQEIGSAFLVAGTYDDVRNQDANAAAQTRANTMDEIIRATGEAFLGMTTGCARCHDHKFDPITSEDYYAMYVAFSGIRHSRAVWDTPERKKEFADQSAPLNAKIKKLEKKRAALDAKINKRVKARAAKFKAKWTRPALSRRKSVDKFKPVTAKFIRLVCESSERDRSKGNEFTIDEFEVWSTEAKPRNLALASNGGKASGSSRDIKDFVGAYGPQLVNDGKFDARFIATEGDLTIELPAPITFNRIVFSSARTEKDPRNHIFRFMVEYRIEVSDDGKTWRKIIDGSDRKPIDGRAGNTRLRKLAASEEEQRELKALDKELTATKAELKKLKPLRQAWIGRRAHNDAKGPFHIFLGGSPQKKGDKVTAASLSTLSEIVPGYKLAADAPEGQRRKHLANWIAHDDNALTLRVLANRLWHYHFGMGIVDTPGDFGYMGGRPTHPKLLDYLAMELRKHNWRLKPIHKQIMSSQAYMQSSAWREDGSKVDGDARLLWRFSPRRLSAEELRDSMLSLSGVLKHKMYGPGFKMYEVLVDNVYTYKPLDKHGPETYRRAVYHQTVRASRVDLMTEFDQPDCAFSAPKRSRTTTPLQALTLLNHSFTIDMAEAFAEQVSKQHQTADAQVTQVFKTAFQRLPSDKERANCQAVVREYGLRPLCRAILNASELIYLD